MKHSVKYEISVRFIDGKVTKRDLAKLHKFTGLSLGELKTIIKEKRLVLGIIVNEQFYSGVEEILGLLNSLESSYKIFSNNSDVNKTFLEDVVYKINNISLRDIR